MHRGANDGDERDKRDISPRKFKRHVRFHVVFSIFMWFSFFVSAFGLLFIENVNRNKQNQPTSFDFHWKVL